MDKAALLALADRVDGAMLSAARRTSSEEPWYSDADQQRDMAFAANCATVAAALRAMAGGEDA